MCIRDRSLYRAIYWGTIWRRPLAELRPRCAEVRDQAIAEGDLVTAATALRNSMMLGWRTVPSLQALDREIVALERELEWLGEPAAKVQAFELRRIIAWLRDRDAPPLVGLAEELANSAGVPGGGTRPRAVLALEVASLSGDWSAAMGLVRRLAPLKSAFDSHPGGVIWRFHEGIYRLKTGRALPSSDFAYVRRAAELNPADHRHKLLVLQAERLRGRGKAACLGVYAVAVDAAAASAFRLEAGLTAELAAEAAREFGHPELAERYLERAQEVWRDWGAVAKLRPDNKGSSAHALPQILEAQAQAAAARRDDRAKSRLLADVAHELRTPLQGMQGLLDLAARDPAAMDLDAFREVFGSLKVVIDDLTDYGALSSGEAPLGAEPTSLPDLVRSEFSVAAGHPALRGARLELDIAADVPAAVATDPARIRQVIRNLLSNAAKYGGGEFMRLTLSRSGTTINGDTRLSLAVEDSGPGLRDGDALLIFEPFERGARQGDGKGLGLGLALSRKIARRLGGDLTAENRREGGARFIFSFAAPAVEVQAESTRTPIRPLRILLAEDVALSRRVIAALLRREGHQVVEAEDGTRALAEARHGGFELLILDMSMPGASGVEVLKGIGGAHGAKTILLTASSSEEVAAEALAAGVDLVLRKPLSAAELGSALSELFQAPARPQPPPAISEELAQLTKAARVELEERVALLNRRQGHRTAGDNAAEAHRIAGLAAQFGWPDVAEQAEAVERAFKVGGGEARGLARDLAARVRALDRA